MPSAMRYIPPTNSERNMFNTAVIAERQDRRAAYEIALKYYDGEHPAQIDVPEDSPDDNVIVNLVKMTADRTASFLFSKMPKFQTDAETVDPTDEEIWLERFFRENGGLERFIKLALRGFLSGHCFIRVKPAPEVSRKNRMPSMLVLDPTMVTVYWRADDVADVVWYELRYNVGEEVTIQDFVYIPETDSWRIYTYSRIMSNPISSVMPDVSTIHGKSLTGDNLLDLLSFAEGTGYKLTETAEHTSHIPPIIDFAHLPDPDSYYGQGEFNQRKLQDTINRVASMLNRIVRENADPVDVIIGAGTDEVEDDGNVMTIASPQAKVSRMEMKGDLSGAVGVFDKLMEIYLSVARVVLLKGEAKDLQRVTNASVRTLFLDALAKNEILKSTYGYALTQVAKLALLMGYEAGQITVNPEGLDVQIEFPEPLPTDMMEVANINAIMVNMMARSLRTAATKMGDNWGFEQQAITAEQEIKMQRMEETMAMQQKFAPTPASGSSGDTNSQEKPPNPKLPLDK